MPNNNLPERPKVPSAVAVGGGLIALFVTYRLVTWVVGAVLFWLKIGIVVAIALAVYAVIKGPKDQRRSS